MKKTIFNNIELLVSVSYDQIYMDTLLAQEIEYTIRDIPLFQPLLPPEIIAYNGYEVIYKDETGKEQFVYPFVTIEYDSTKCVTFFPDRQLDNVYLLDLELALRTGKLIYETTDEPDKVPSLTDAAEDGFSLSSLLGKELKNNDGSCYQFTSQKTFPKGVQGRKYMPDGTYVSILLIYIDGVDPLFVINEEGSGWSFIDSSFLSRLEEIK